LTFLFVSRFNVFYFSIGFYFKTLTKVVRIFKIQRKAVSKQQRNNLGYFILV